MARAPGATKLFFVSGSPFASLCLQFFSGFAALEFIGSLPAFRLQFLVPRRHRQARPVLTSPRLGTCLHSFLKCVRWFMQFLKVLVSF